MDFDAFVDSGPVSDPLTFPNDLSVGSSWQVYKLTNMDLSLQKCLDFVAFLKMDILVLVVLMVTQQRKQNDKSMKAHPFCYLLFNNDKSETERGRPISKPTR